MAILDMRVVAGHERVAELNMREGDGLAVRGKAHLAAAATLTLPQ